MKDVAHAVLIFRSGSSCGTAVEKPFCGRGVAMVRTYGEKSVGRLRAAFEQHWQINAKPVSSRHPDEQNYPRSGDRPARMEG
jgi:hypothetical protein